MDPLRPPLLQSHVGCDSPTLPTWFPRADALATCRAPTVLPICVIFLLVANWTILELIMSLSWELRAGMRSMRPRSQLLWASFTVYAFLADTGSLVAGVALES